MLFEHRGGAGARDSVLKEHPTSRRPGFSYTLSDPRRRSVGSSRSPKDDEPGDCGDEPLPLRSTRRSHRACLSTARGATALDYVGKKVGRAFQPRHFWSIGLESPTYSRNFLAEVKNTWVATPAQGPRRIGCPPRPGRAQLAGFHTHVSNYIKSISNSHEGAGPAIYLTRPRVRHPRTSGT